MRLEQIGAYGYGVQAARVKRKEQDGDAEAKRAGSSLSRKDSYNPSADVHKAESLKEVKQRLKANFYQSDEVNEDLADMFTKLFDR